MSASGAITQAALVLVDLETDAGITGKAYLFAFTPSMLKPTIQCVEAVSELIRGDVRPVEVSDGYVLIPDEHGVGLEWDEDAVARYAV